MIHGQLTTQCEYLDFVHRWRIYTATLRRPAYGAGPIEYPAGCTLDTYTALWIAIFARSASSSISRSSAQRTNLCAVEKIVQRRLKLLDEEHDGLCGTVTGCRRELADQRHRRRLRRNHPGPRFESKEVAARWRSRLSSEAIVRHVHAASCPPLGTGRQWLFRELDGDP